MNSSQPKHDRRQTSLLHILLRLALAVSLGLVLAACGTLVEQPPKSPIEATEDPPVEETPSDDEPDDGAGESMSWMTLYGDPSFDVAGLVGDERLWFERALGALEGSTDDMLARAESDDSYQYGRVLFQFSSAALLGLRATGFLGFLDAVDPVMEALRAQLSDSWCGDVASSVYVNSKYGTVSEPDGFRNFRVWYEAGMHQCRDTGDLNEALTHGHLAMVMYAYHVNRDAVSPAGIDYGERADFWFDYLRNDFEAKWRSRSGVVWPAMDFINLRFSHTYHVFSLYYYFMGKRLESVGDPDAAAYLAMVDSLTDAQFEQPYVPGEHAGGFVDVSGPTGDAFVYSFGAPGWGEVSDVLMEASPMTYSRYVMSAVLTLWAEGVDRWDDDVMMRLTNGLTGFVIDVDDVSSSSDTIAASVVGEETVGGIPPTTYRDRLSVGAFGETSMPAFSVWDASGVLEAFSLDVYGVVEWDEGRPVKPFIPASMLFVETSRSHELGLMAAR